MSQCSEKYQQLKQKILFAKAKERNKYSYLKDKFKTEHFPITKKIHICPKCNFKYYYKCIRCPICGAKQ